MPRLSDETALSPLPSGRSGKPIATFDTTAIGRGIERLGAGVAKLGASFSSSRSGSKAAYDTERRWQEFRWQEIQRYNKALDGVAEADEPPEGFADAYRGIVRERGQSFFETVPDIRRETYATRLNKLEDGLYGNALEFEETGQRRFYTRDLDRTIRNTVLPSVRSSASVNRGMDERLKHLESARSDAAALVETNPALSPDERAGLKERTEHDVEREFVRALPAVDRADILKAREAFHALTADELMESARSGRRDLVRAEQEEQALAQGDPAVESEGYGLLATGEMTLEWLEANWPRIGRPASRAFSRATGDPSPVRTISQDAFVLMDMAYSGGEDSIPDIAAAYGAGLIDRDTYAGFYDVAQRAEALPGHVRQAREQVRDAVAPGANATADDAALALRAMRGFDAWTADNASAPQKDVQSFAAGLIEATQAERRLRGRRSLSPSSLVPSPMSSAGPEQVARARAKLVSMGASGAMTTNEIAREARKLMRWSEIATPEEAKIVNAQFTMPAPTQAQGRSRAQPTPPPQPNMEELRSLWERGNKPFVQRDLGDLADVFPHLFGQVPVMPDGSTLSGSGWNAFQNFRPELDEAGRVKRNDPKEFWGELHPNDEKFLNKIVPEMEAELKKLEVQGEESFGMDDIISDFRQAFDRGLVDEKTFLNLMERYAVIMRKLYGPKPKDLNIPMV